MKITCNRRDEVLKRKAEAEAQHAEQKSRYEAQYSAYRDEYDEVLQGIVDDVHHRVDHLGLNLRITADQRWGSGIYIHVMDEDNLHNPDKALSWKWSVGITAQGELEKESSSWSGMNATSQANLDSLQTILECLRILNNIDWKVVLDRQLPKYSERVTEKDPGRVPDFTAELLQADLDDAVGADKLIRGRATDNSGYRGHGYYLILKETPAQYAVKYIPETYLDRLTNINNLSVDEIIAEMRKSFNTFNIRKSKITEVFGGKINFYEGGE